MTTNILSWIPHPLDIIANKRNGPDTIKARKRISGRWNYNRFFNYHYKPSPEYFRYILKLKNKNHGISNRRMGEMYSFL